MAKTDALRWNQRYLNEEYPSSIEPRPFLLEVAEWLPSSGLALDVAMGRGGNAIYLIEHGMQVVGVDIAWQGVVQAKRRQNSLMAVVADLDHFYLPDKCFNLIINFYFLDRTLWPVFRRCLRPGGTLVIETLTTAMLQHNPEIDPVYLLQPGELTHAFADLRIIQSREGWAQLDTPHPRAVACLAAQLL